MRSEPANGARPMRWSWVLGTLCALVLALVLFRPRLHDKSTLNPTGAQTADAGINDVSAGPSFPPELGRLVHAARTSTPAAEEIVSRKLAQFARSRREYVYELAKRHNVQVPPDVERFFAAVEGGNWDEIQNAFKKINGGDSSASHGGGRPPGVNELWSAIIDAYGAAEQVHLWPAQKLLDYGNSILDSLRPGMVYVGGTDNGRWIPELLNDTSEGEQHVIVTQNGLADGMYLDYLRLQYDGQLANLSPEDSQRAFNDYLTDAQKRLQHDQQFPNEPKQVLPGEDINMVDGKVQVSGQTAVMAINERLLETLMQKNPDVSFAIQESFPLKGTYPDALPLGPLMELGARSDQNYFTPERAAQSLDYWRSTAQQVLSDPTAAGSDATLKSYSHDVVSTANLLAAHNFSGDAEEAYRLGTQLWPANPESASGLADLLAANGRDSEARQVLDDFARQYPDQRQQLERSSAAIHLIWTAK